jgi:hypothetical protein
LSIEPLAKAGQTHLNWWVFLMRAERGAGISGMVSLRRKLFHHEGHEEHEVLKSPIGWFFFVLFVLFVVKIGKRPCA